jgi:hypothetical protein
MIWHTRPCRSSFMEETAEGGEREHAGGNQRFSGDAEQYHPTPPTVARTNPTLRTLALITSETRPLTHGRGQKREEDGSHQRMRNPAVALTL